MQPSAFPQQSELVSLQRQSCDLRKQSKIKKEIKRKKRKDLAEKNIKKCSKISVCTEVMYRFQTTIARGQVTGTRWRKYPARNKSIRHVPKNIDVGK